MISHHHLSECRRVDASTHCYQHEGHKEENELHTCMPSTNLEWIVEEWKKRTCKGDITQACSNTEKDNYVKPYVQGKSGS